MIEFEIKKISDINIVTKKTCDINIYKYSFLYHHFVPICGIVKYRNYIKKKILSVLKMKWLEKSKNYRCVHCDYVTKHVYEMKWHLEDYHNEAIHHNTEKPEQLHHKCHVLDGFKVG
jgi:hypothetical protein